MIHVRKTSVLLKIAISCLNRFAHADFCKKNLDISTLHKYAINLYHNSFEMINFKLNFIKYS